MTMLVFKSEAESCAVCEHAIDGAVIDGYKFPKGWHCDVNDCAATNTKTAEKFALRRIPELWEDGDDDE